MRAYEARKPSYFATPAVSLIIALHVSLKQLMAQGMDRRFQLHLEASAKFKDQIMQWGLKLVCREKIRIFIWKIVLYDNGNGDMSRLI